ncbi:biosynthetic-type acetolactate synthase large subunit [Acidaminobacter sp. JC074]|uniref:biosynthetic-type acetolactate synthase large subunit n=1 Tax=Acidaminobacter sp. JC074 TaxID=2530199 RepID=UPI001F0D9874|nr:biosynthetic-type acetolactate synthase large subunit [Acidaminobacter sp. JC074]MCH4888361.1 biosynthetic-type acetolactate synthase large subunit [Acidaminobacter sp. JC074]
MKVANAIVKHLEKEKITTVFGYPGGAVIALYDELRKSDIKHVLVRNEQSAVHYASGYARESSSVGVCIATSGPGATNLITGIATAYMDSIPIVIITGQVHSDLIGTDAFQEADITGATQPFTKHSYLLRRGEDISKVLNEAFHIASSGRPGPVLIDIPSDVFSEKVTYEPDYAIDIQGYKPTTVGHKGQIKRSLNKLKNAERPLIFAGGGVVSSDAKEELRTFAESNRLPVVCSLMGLGAFDHASELYCGLVGSHGNLLANDLFLSADVILIFGARMSNRAMHKLDELNSDVVIIHVDVDPAEISKNLSATIPVVGDAKNILDAFNAKGLQLDTSEWLKSIEKRRFDNLIDTDDNMGLVSPKRFMKHLSDQLSDSSVVVADVGQNQFWTTRNIEVIKDRKFMTSGGLGTMGYSLPASLGAKLSCPEKQVICTIGDGGIQMCLGELAVLSEQKLGVKLIIFKNSRLGMVRELQDNIYGKNRAFGVHLDFEVDFVQLGKAYGIKGYRIESDDEIENVVEALLKDDEPCIVECMVSPEYATL